MSNCSKIFPSVHPVGTYPGVAKPITGVFKKSQEFPQFEAEVRKIER